MVKVWDTATSEEILTLKGRIVHFSPDGQRLAGVGPENTLKVWDLAAGQEVLVLKLGFDRVNTVRYSPDGRLLAAVGGYDPGPGEPFHRPDEVRLWDTISGQEVLVPKGQTVAFSPNGKCLATSEWPCHVTVWDLVAGREACSLQGDSRRHYGGVTEPIFSPDSNRLIAVLGDGTLRVWDLTTNQEALALGEEIRHYFNSVILSPDGQRAAFFGLDGPPQDVARNVAGGIDGRERPTNWNGFTPGTTKVWDLTTGRLAFTFKINLSVSNSQLFFSADGKRLAYQCNNLVKVWDLTSD
jgi:WD40 repeat protein